MFFHLSNPLVLSLFCISNQKKKPLYFRWPEYCRNQVNAGCTVCVPRRCLYTLLRSTDFCPVCKSIDQFSAEVAWRFLIHRIGVCLVSVVDEASLAAVLLGGLFLMLFFIDGKRIKMWIFQFQYPTIPNMLTEKNRPTMSKMSLCNTLTLSEQLKYIYPPEGSFFPCRSSCPFE